MSQITTLETLLSYGEHYLCAAKKKEAKTQALRLLQAVSGYDKSFIVLYSNHTPSEEVIHTYHQALKRLVQEEPISRIVGRRDFWKDTFQLSADTLDPRSDSETLIEAILELNVSPSLVLDLGVGSGCLLLSLLREYPKAYGIGVDLAWGAVYTAQRNAFSLNLKERAGFIQGSWGEGCSGTFDLIISNPPYIPTKDIETLDLNVRAYDPILALDGGEDGYEVYRKFAKDLKAFLTDHGHIVLEIGQGQHECVKSLFLAQNLQCVLEKSDLSGIVRALVFQK